MKKQRWLCACAIILILFCLTGCGGEDSSVKVYENTEESTTAHDERSMTAIITGMDMENNQISFVSIQDGSEQTLLYHGGVSVCDTDGNDIGIGSIACGSVVDVTYYSDTEKLVRIAENANVKTSPEEKKFIFRQDTQTASCGGSSYELSEYVRAFDGDTEISLQDITTEDEVTLSVWNDKLLSVVVTKGHGYVRLLNQGTYIGGFVEIGKDVIVPVTEDMLITVGAGDYTLRIGKDGYSGEKKIRVTRDRELNVDISDIAIPTGTVTFTVTPEGVAAEIKVDGDVITDNTYTGLYGSHELSVTAEGYDDFRGSFKISDTVKTLRVTLQEETTEETTEETSETEEDQSATETTTAETTTAATTTAETTETTAATTTETTTATTEQTTVSEEQTEAAEQGNTITVRTPEGVGVYLDGDYIGIAPVTVAKTVGTHTITLYKAGYLIRSYTIEAEDNGQNDEYSYPDLISVLD